MKTAEQKKIDKAIAQIELKKAKKKYKKKMAEMKKRNAKVGIKGVGSMDGLGAAKHYKSSVNTRKKKLRDT